MSPISGSLSDLESSGGGNNTNNAKSRPQSATNELPLTELNLALFTSEFDCFNNKMSNSTNELPLSDLRFTKSASLSKQGTIDSQNDDVSMVANLETDLNSLDCKNKLKQRSFSDPNILNVVDKEFMLRKYNDSLIKLDPPPSPPPLVPIQCMCIHRSPTNLLSFFTSNNSERFNNTNNKRTIITNRSYSHPSASCVLNPCMFANVENQDKSTTTTATTASSATCSSSTCQTTRRHHRHSIAGQMSYYKMLGFGGVQLKKFLTNGSGNSTNSLFSTAVISGSSSAPNLRDMIPSTASASGILPTAKQFITCN